MACRFREPRAKSGGGEFSLTTKLLETTELADPVVLPGAMEPQLKPASRALWDCISIISTPTSIMAFFKLWAVTMMFWLCWFPLAEMKVREVLPTDFADKRISSLLTVVMSAI